MARIRSPNYPALSLAEAISRVERVHARERQHPASREVILKGMGYSGVHGTSLGALSAAMKYGLLEQKGKGEDYRVTDRAMAILHPHTPEEKATAIREAARSPALFAELLDHFKGTLPSDDNLRAYLVRRGFSQTSLPGVIQAFRDTLELVSPVTGGYTPLDTREEKPMTPATDLGSGRVAPQTPPLPPGGEEPIRMSILGNHIDLVARLETPEQIDELMRKLKFAKLMITPIGPMDTGQSDTDEEAAN